MTNYQGRVFWLIGIATVIRICFSVTTELGNVEVYYWSWSVIPQLNYVDHPPLVAWMISATTLGQTFVNEFTVRLGPVIAAAICTWLFYKAGEQVRDKRTGWYAALCYSTCVYTSAVAGKYVLPDSPQLIFWLASLLIILKLLVTAPGDARARRYWLLFGLTSGLCIMCKVHGAFIWLGVLLYCLLYERNHFKHRYIYLSAAITLVIISPIVIWNIDHNWYTLKFQGPRFVITGSGIDFKRFLAQLAGTIAVIGPIHFYLVWRCIYLISRGKFSVSGNQIKLLLCCSLPLIIFLFILSLFREVYAHWPGPAYAALLILPALDIASNSKKVNRVFPKVLAWSAAYCLFVLLIQPLVINYFPGTTSTEKEGVNVGRDDATVDMIGWKQAGDQYKIFYDKAVLEKSIRSVTPIIVTSWTPGAAIDFYMARKTGQRVLGIGGLDSLHQYYLMNSGKKMLSRGDDAIYIVPSNHTEMNTMEKVTAHFDSAVNVLTVPYYRANLLCKQTYVFLLKNYDGKIMDLK